MTQRQHQPAAPTAPTAPTAPVEMLGASGMSLWTRWAAVWPEAHSHPRLLIDDHMPSSHIYLPESPVMLIKLAMDCPKWKTSPPLLDLGNLIFLSRDDVDN
jgi:hypothetical protein